jgi:hypothetical protein
MRLYGYVSLAIKSDVITINMQISIFVTFAFTGYILLQRGMTLRVGRSLRKTKILRKYMFSYIYFAFRL